MRLLFVSNLYPPFHIGGYEMACMDIAEDFKKRGHEVHVLTSVYGLREPRDEKDVYRRLYLYRSIYPMKKPPVLNQSAYEAYNYFATAELLRRLDPDCVFFWNMAAITLGPVAAAEELGFPAVHYLSDNHMSHYLPSPQAARRQKTVAGAVLQMLGRLFKVYPGMNPDALITVHDVALKNVMITSKAMKDMLLSSGVPVDGAEVVYHGVRLEDFPEPAPRKSGSGTRLLFAGQVEEHKGVHVIIEALAKIGPARLRESGITLDVVGSGSPHYFERLKGMVERHGLKDAVSFLGRRSRNEVRKAYTQYDVFLFSTISEEPFSIGLLEAMASGIAVIGTTTGGSKEILVNGENALVYSHKNPAELAEKIVVLASNSDMRHRLAENARKVIERNYTFERMASKMEDYIRTVVDSEPKGTPWYTPLSSEV